MFKKFINFFFEEEEQVSTQIDEDYEEEPVIPTRVKEEPVFYEVAHKPSTFIDLESSKEEQPKREEKPQRKEKVSKVVPPKHPQTDYVFTSVISPIFGTSEEVKKPSQAPASGGTAVSSQAKDSLLGTIISPIYGKVSQTPSRVVVEEEVKEEVALPPMFALDELIAKHQKLEEEVDGPHQFSLFEVEEQPQHTQEEEQEEFGIREYFDAKRK